MLQPQVASHSPASLITSNPLFPHFKKLELVDRNAIEAFTAQFEPYSDFCFSTLWFYDIGQHTTWCWLNGNLVVSHADVFVPGKALTILGSNHLVETTKELLTYAVQFGYSTELWRVPEVVATELQGHFTISECRDSFDYCYSVDRLGTLPSVGNSELRRKINIFTREFPDCEVSILDINNFNVRQELYSVITSWRGIKTVNATLNQYCLAAERCLDHATDLDISILGAIQNNRLLGYLLLEPRTNKWLFSHFSANIPGAENISSYLLHHSCRYGMTIGATKINLQEDLGNQGIRRYKMSCTPEGFLRKYSVGLKSER